MPLFSSFGSPRRTGSFLRIYRDRRVFEDPHRLSWTKPEIFRIGRHFAFPIHHHKAFHVARQRIDTKELVVWCEADLSLVFCIQVGRE